MRKHPIHLLLAQWLQFANKVPKGFGKFFDKNPQTASAKKPESAGDKKTEPSPPSPSDSQPKSKKPKEKTFEFKFEFNKDKSGKGGSGGGGSPLGNGNSKERLFLYGGLAVGAIIGFYAFNEIVYQEIGWQEFVTKYGYRTEFKRHFVVDIDCLYLQLFVEGSGWQIGGSQ